MHWSKSSSYLAYDGTSYSNLATVSIAVVGPHAGAERQAEATRDAVIAQAENIFSAAQQAARGVFNQAEISAANAFENAPLPHHGASRPAPGRAEADHANCQESVKTLPQFVNGVAESKGGTASVGGRN